MGSSGTAPLVRRQVQDRLPKIGQRLVDLVQAMTAQRGKERLLHQVIRFDVARPDNRCEPAQARIQGGELLSQGLPPQIPARLDSSPLTIAHTYSDTAALSFVTKNRRAIAAQRRGERTGRCQGLTRYGPFSRSGGCAG